jgi:hypothetical protein
LWPKSWFGGFDYGIYNVMIVDLRTTSICVDISH